MFTVKLACYTWKSVEKLIYLDQPCQNIRPSLGHMPFYAMQSAVSFSLEYLPLPQALWYWCCPGWVKCLVVPRPEGGLIFGFIFSLKAVQVSCLAQDGQDVLFKSTTTGR